MRGKIHYRLVLAILGVVALLLNPAGICAGTMTGMSPSPSHPCCPKSAPDGSTSPCVCIDRQPEAPSAPSLSHLAHFDAALPSPAAMSVTDVAHFEYRVRDHVPQSLDGLFLSIHQLLL
jgi:hypothetical protein